MVRTFDSPAVMVVESAAVILKWCMLSGMTVNPAMELVLNPALSLVSIVVTATLAVPVTLLLK